MRLEIVCNICLLRYSIFAVLMSAILRACEFIRNRLASGYWQQGQRLPSLAGLARQCGVSRTTMWTAVDCLQKESLLCTRRGGAILAGSDSRSAPDQTSTGLLWERLKARIGREILSGNFSENRAPLVSKLSLHYGVTSRTLKKALDDLVKEGLLIMAGRRYAVSVLRTNIHRPEIVAIAEAGSVPGDPRAQKVIVSFEREASKLGYSCRFEGFSAREARGMLDIRQTIGKIPDLGGCIVTMWNPWDATIRKRWFELLAYLAQRSVPVIVIDQSGEIRFPEALLRCNRFRVLRIAEERAGEMVAGALFQRGHRSIAYLTASLNFAWAQRRHAGIAGYVGRYGDPKSKVELFTLSQRSDQTEKLLAILDLDNKGIGALYRDARSKDEILDLQKNLSKVRNEEMAITRSSPPATTIHRLAGFLADLSGQVHDPVMYRMVLENLLHLAGDMAYGLYLAPLFDKALTTGDATAWVCSEEKIAVAAVSFLRAHNKRVPRDIAVIGFDNWDENIEQHLSTYDFNMDGMVKEALLMIVDEKSMKARPVISEVDGYLVERRTTRR
jgi:DNA-binding LacI/PurR family transcriptional regulator/DNA-binding GntR family transcriptional regulator